jgi:GcrA cell cycle regulator
MSPASTWTDARIEILTRLWREGQSASAIARQLGGVTRNAVIGKVHRLGVAGRAIPAPPGVRRAVRPPRPQRRLRPPPRPRRLAAEPAPSDPGLSGTSDTLAVGAHACRWPIGDPKAAGFALCGRPAVRGAYCAHHGAMAYRAPPRDHLLKLAGLA